MGHRIVIAQTCLRANNHRIMRPRTDQMTDAQGHAA